jgi:hypothetical protein
MRTEVFWVLMQRIVAISYRRFGTTNRSRLPETSVINYHYLLRNNSEERNSHLLRDEITNFAKFRPALRHDPSISVNASSQRSLISKDKHFRYDKKYAALFTSLNPTVSNVHRSSTVQINIQRFEEWRSSLSYIKIYFQAERKQTPCL